MAGTNQGRLIATIGPPGAGKTTWRHTHAEPGMTVVSLDDDRRALSWCGCSSNQDTTALAVAAGLVAAHTALARGGTVLWDATNAEPAARRLLLALGAEHHAHTTAVVLLPPLDVVLAGNGRRDSTPCLCGWARRVPDPVVRAMHAAITADLPQLHTEGWTQVHRVHRLNTPG